MGRERAIFAAAAAAAILASVAVFAFPQDRVTVDVLDVGQGDAVLVSSGRTQMLIDGGPDRKVLSELGRTMPFFDRTIEFVVLTHPHADHYRGLAAVLGRYGVGALLVSGSGSGSAEYAEFLADAGSRVPVTEVRSGDSLRVGKGSAEVIWPDEGGARSRDPNASSVVILLSAFGRPAALLTGDATGDVEQALLRKRTDVQAPVLKVGHHGSGSSSTAAFLKAVAPEHAIIPVGKNRYGHPSPSALLRLKAVGARVWQTDKDGTVRAVFRPSGYRIFRK